MPDPTVTNPTEGQNVETPANDQTPAGTPPVETPPSPEGNWYDGYGDMGETFKSFGSKEEVLSALERGKNYHPATDIKEINLEFPKGIEVDEASMTSYKEFCVQNGITAEQAKALSQWQVNQILQNTQKIQEDGKAALKSLWGNNYDKNVEKSLSTLATLDRRMGGRLSVELNRSGGANNPVIVEALHVIGSLISEDSLSGAAAAPGEEEPMSTKEFLQKEVFGGK